ncbi:MAG: hypothetical protein HQM06_01680 [Magnetococcales bacterium]|nr:hypothetical protein [Magnetococcales bacterium]
MNQTPTYPTLRLTAPLANWPDQSGVILLSVTDEEVYAAEGSLPSRFQEILEQHARQKGNQVSARSTAEGEGISSLNEFGNASLAELQRLLQETVEPLTGNHLPGYSLQLSLRGRMAKQCLGQTVSGQEVASYPRCNALLRRYAQWQQTMVC